jgi:hypothetical protein
VGFPFDERLDQKFVRGVNPTGASSGFDEIRDAAASFCPTIWAVRFCRKLNLIGWRCSNTVVVTIAQTIRKARVDEGVHDYASALKGWAAILQRFVDDEGRIAFAALAQDRADLDRFVEYLARVSPASTPDRFDSLASILAYHINAYNALAMHGVIEKNTPEGFDNFFRRAAFYWLRKQIIGGKRTSLYDYENKIIRPLGEPRVHFALNCMVRGCPRMPQTPFVLDDLEAQLQAVTVEFFGSDRHLRVDHGRREVLVSEILRFYTVDFVGSNKPQELVAYINRYRTDPVAADYEVRFIPYDWTINDQA